LKPFQLIFHYARKYTWALIVTAASMLALVGAQLLIPWIIKLLVGAVTEPSGTLDVMGFVTRLTVIVLAVYVARAVLQFLRSYLAHIAGWGVVADVRMYIYEHMQRLSLRFYEDKQVGTLMSNVVNDTDLFEQLIAHAIPDVVVNVLTFVAVTAVLLSLNWQLTLLSTIPIPLVIVSLRVYAKYVRPAFRLDMFYTPVRNLSGAWEAVQGSLAGADRISGLMTEEEEPHNVLGATSITGRVQGEIRFQEASFEYSPGNLVLEDISLDIPAHQAVALVGPTELASPPWSA
jgi:ABC-type multidrug transport system fused ATPase/permease subunit